MKRVLFLAYLFPPIANSGTQRPLKFAKYLRRYGWEPVVVTAAHPEAHAIDAGLLEELPASLRVIRVPMLNEQVSDWISAAGLRTRLARRVADGVSWRLQTRFRSPDLYALWRPMVRRAGISLFNREGFDAIYATGFPWSTLLAGADIARATGRPLLADFRDPWAGEEQRFRAAGRPAPDHERAMEAAVLRQATIAISTAPFMTRHLMAAHPEIDPSKFDTVYNGYDPVDLEPPPPRTDRTFRMVYTGAWKDGYTLTPLYDVIDWIRRSQPRLLDGVELVAAGFTPGEAARRGLADHIHELGVVPHRDAVALMQGADVLFMNNAEGHRQQIGVPGKLYEYLATGRPVLALTDPDGDAGMVLRRTGGGVAVRADDPGLLYDAIAAICRNRQLTVPPLDRTALASFERVTLTGKLAALLDEAVARTSLAAGQTTETGTPPVDLKVVLYDDMMRTTGSGRSSDPATRSS